jgi:hypothetical protein
MENLLQLTLFQLAELEKLEKGKAHDDPNLAIIDSYESFAYMIHHLSGKVISRATFERIWQNKLKYERDRFKLMYKEIPINAKVSIGIFFDNMLYFITQAEYGIQAFLIIEGGDHPFFIFSDSLKIYSSYRS